MRIGSEHHGSGAARLICTVAPVMTPPEESLTVPETVAALSTWHARRNSTAGKAQRPWPKKNVSLMLAALRS